jgi:cyclophilin family peptidyl-prolyl cis-trans isomerase
MKAIWCFVACLILGQAASRAGTLAIFDSSVGSIYMELFDKDKPVTARNFIDYIRTGRFTNMIVQRWEPKFVIQGGQYYIENPTSSNATFRTIPTFGTITNEYYVGDRYSNVYGTIAMARQPGNTNSATSQWFLNLTNNAFLDNVDGGFTVFGKVIRGTNNLNKFYPPPPVNGIYKSGTIQGVNDYGEPIFMDTMPVLSTNPTFNDLIYLNAKLVECQFHRSGLTLRDISWNSVEGITNRVQVSTNYMATWENIRDVVGTGEVMTISERTAETTSRLYRVQLLFN